jgi:hypothetical protein
MDHPQKYGFLVQHNSQWQFVGFHEHLDCPMIRGFEAQVERELGADALLIIEMPEPKITTDWDQDLAKLLRTQE